MQYFYVMMASFLILTSCKGEELSMPNKKEETASLSRAEGTNVIDTIAIDNAPNVITRNIIQDQKGNIWFATFGGMIKYDGVSFTDMTKDVSDGRFFTVLEDRKGNIWFGSIGDGAFRYDGKSFQNFTTKDGLADDQVKVIYEDSEGYIWLGTVGGLSRYDGKSFQNFTMEQGLTYNDINSIIEDKNGLFWIGTRGDACTFDGNTFTKITFGEGRAFTNTRQIIEDRKGDIWLGGNEGIGRYDGKEFKQLHDAFTGYLLEDHKGNIWTSSAGWTLTRYDGSSLESDQVNATEVKTLERMFFGILEDSDGNIWVGKLDGVYRYDGKKLTYFLRKNAFDQGLVYPFEIK